MLIIIVMLGSFFLLLIWILKKMWEAVRWTGDPYAFKKEHFYYGSSLDDPMIVKKRKKK